MLAYFQPKVKAKFYENARKLHFRPIFGPFLSILRKTRNLLKNSLLTLFSLSRFLSLCIISEETNGQIPRKAGYRHIDRGENLSKTLGSQMVENIIFVKKLLK